MASDDILDEVFKSDWLTERKSSSSRNEVFDITREYNRTSYDDIQGRTSFLDQQFDNKKTIKDSITKDTLHRNRQAASNKYGHDHASRHTADVDHIVPLRDFHERVKNNPFVNDEDKKRIANSPENLSIKSSHLNRQKGAKSNIDIALDRDIDIPLKGRAKLITQQFGAESAVNARIAAATVKNGVTEFAEGAVFALEASAVSLLVEGIHNLHLIGTGEKDIDDAISDMGRYSAMIAASGGAMHLISSGLSGILNKSKSELLKNIANSGVIYQVISVGLMLKDAFTQYINGEIDGKQLMGKIAEKGLSLYLGATGALIMSGPVIAALICSTLIQTVCSYICKDWYSLDQLSEAENTVSRLANEALIEIRRQQEIVRSIAEREFKEREHLFDTGFMIILNSASNPDYGDNIAEIADGLNHILSVFDETVPFASREEFDEFWNDDDAVFTF